MENLKNTFFLHKKTIEQDTYNNDLKYNLQLTTLQLNEKSRKYVVQCGKITIGHGKDIKDPNDDDGQEEKQ